MFENFLRSLLSQLSYRRQGIPAALMKLYHAHGDGRAQPSLESLNDTLRSMVEGFGHVYIMVDSLDECGDRAELLRWIQTTASWNSDKLHLLFTSRREPDIRSQLDNIARLRHVMIDGKSQQDILLYLDEQLRPIHWDETTRELVKITVGGRADGMCVLVRLLHPHVSLMPDIGSDGSRCRYLICSNVLTSERSESSWRYYQKIWKKPTNAYSFAVPAAAISFKCCTGWLSPLAP